MFYLVMIPITVYMLIELRHLTRLRKHDRVLFPICEIRGDLVRSLMRSEDAGTLTRDDYIYARLMLNALNHTVGLYKHHRTRFFNLRAYARFCRQYQASAKELMAVPRTENTELRAIEHRFNHAMLRGFLTYTPYLKSEILIYLVLAVMAFFASLGLTFVARRLKETREVVALVREQARAVHGNGNLTVA